MYRFKYINLRYIRTLKLVFNVTPNLSFDELLVTDKSVGIHQRNLQLLATKIFKVKNGTAPEQMSEILQFEKKLYNLKNASTVYNCIETLS